MVVGSSSSSPGEKIKLGVAILTRFPITERATAGRTGVLDNLQASLKGATLLERVLGEITASAVLQWFEQISSSFGSPRILPKIQMFLVYRMNYTSVFSLSGWFSVLPNHLLNNSTLVKKPGEFEDSTLGLKGRRYSDILSKTGHNLNNDTFGEDSDVYCSSRQLLSNSTHGHCRLSTYHRTRPTELESELATNEPGSIVVPVEYVTVEGLEMSRLLEVALRAALRSGCDYVLVLNPRAIGLKPSHLSAAIQLLTGTHQSIKPNHIKEFPDQSYSSPVDIVLGLTTPSSHMGRSTSNICSPGPVSTALPNNPFASPSGLYLLGLRAGRGVMLGAHQLTSSVEWATSTTGTRLWTNLSRWFSNWNVITQPPDLLSVEQHIGLGIDHLLEDSITVIIPMGPGHADDLIDPEEDLELVDVQNSKALAVTLELAVCNASGKRSVEIIIITSETSSRSRSHSVSTPPIMDPLSPDSLRGPSLSRSTRLRPMIKVSVHHYMRSGPSTTEASSPSIPSDTYPRRGELIRYAAEHLARGSMLVFVEPGNHQIPC
ncbi:unnamed protein product [Echinostoma caproni]|uniref:DUF1995 domain-containing protein n=1 Tax=Echinostoma caproni TaxID=27848 RepID=A0A183AIU5_9TREM|nr:unnamed protein product [Echinostoma caproni]